MVAASCSKCGQGPEDGARSESWQMYEVDRQVDPAQLAAIKEKLETFRVVVTLARVSKTGPPCANACARSPKPPAEQPAAAAGEEIEEGHALLEVDGRRGTSCSSATGTIGSLAARSADRLVSDAAPASASCDPGDRRAATAIDAEGEVREHARARELMIITKANSTATVHRGTYLDYIGVKTFGPRGEVTGEHRFLGLVDARPRTTAARTTFRCCGRRCERVIDHFALDPASHDAKAVPPRAGNVSARRAVPGERGGSDPHLARRREPLRAAHGAPAGATRSVPSLLFVPHLCAARPVQHRSAARDRADRGARLRRHRRSSRKCRSRTRTTRACTSSCAPNPNDKRTVDLHAHRAAASRTRRPRGTIACAPCSIGKQDEASALALANRYRRVFPHGL